MGHTAWLYFNFCEFISVANQDVQFWRHTNGKLTQKVKENEGEKSVGGKGRARTYSSTVWESGIQLVMTKKRGHFGGGAPNDNEKCKLKEMLNLRMCVGALPFRGNARERDIARSLAGIPDVKRPEFGGKEPDDAHACRISLMGRA